MRLGIFLRRRRERQLKKNPRKLNEKPYYVDKRVQNPILFYFKLNQVEFIM